MIVPSLSCQASCRYCFGPHKGPQMDKRTAEETVRFVHRISSALSLPQLSVIFHGGEPLLASYEVWETLLAELSRPPGGIPVSFSVQSNLWNLDARFLSLFREYHVSIGTSLDGPEAICDANRGAGYFQRTMASVEMARSAGQETGAIVTLTRASLPKIQEILTFFRDQGINPVLHAAVRGMNAPADPDPFALTAEEYADAIIGIYPWYIKNRKYFSVSTLDHYCRAVVLGEPGVCTMQDCLGMFLAVSPTGDITGCQRMAGIEKFRLGNIFESPDAGALFASPAWQALKEREEEVSKRCRDCPYLSICRGGCYYNALASGDGVIDPLCGAYRRIYAYLKEKVVGESSLPENLEAIRRPPEKDEHLFLRSGPYISLAYKPHPSVIAENARRILGAYALGAFPDLDRAARFMTDSHFSAGFESTKDTLAVMERRLKRERSNLNNCYIHTTFRCNLRCAHCYASAGGERTEEMPVPEIAKLSEEAIRLGFRQLIFTGGEPLFHRERGALLALCTALRGRGSNVILRTNLAGKFSDEELLSVARAFDQVVVSVDGDQKTHDMRRGTGTYDATVSNCIRYRALMRSVPGGGELSLACVLPAAEINGDPGRSVRALGAQLDIPRVRFRPLLPLGRAAESDEPPFCECINQHEAVRDLLKHPFTPMLSCGIGQNIYICPDGRSYPCYAWQTEHSYLGNVMDEGLEKVLLAPAFTRLRGCTVDTIRKCRDCKLRYLCGGACRAWGNREETDPDTAPPVCGHLQLRARELIAEAKKYLTE